ncbi:MAG TPA: cobalamin B12-binding domain-containing protein [Nitrososphaerales archaeon]|nr:cobalamin B12-binding domain-containing protein [Nitrososphaerales archaeon]
MTSFLQVAPQSGRIRVLVAKPGLDGHDRGALVLSRAFRDAGMEVIYSGLLPTPEQVAQMAVDEDVDVVALSLLNGAHMTAFPKVVNFLKKKGGKDILVIGGGIIPEADKSKLERLGIRGNFGPGTSLKTIVDYIHENLKKPKIVNSKSKKREKTTKTHLRRFSKE